MAETQRISRLVAILAFATLGTAQELLRTHYGVLPHRCIGVFDLGHVSSNVVRDYAVSYGRGISVHSGPSGAQVWRRDFLPIGIVGTAGAVQDWNGDGYPDLAVAIPGYTGSPGGVDNQGTVFVLSGLDGSELAQMLGGSISYNLGHGVAGIGDVNGDGFSDLAAAGAPGTFGPDVRVYLGPSGSLLRQHAGAGIGVASQMDGMGDVDGDGFDDYLVGWPTDSATGSFRGSVSLFSGATGSVIHQLFGEADDDNFGTGLGNAGDLDGDRVNDFWVGAPGSTDGLFGGVGYVDLYSGATGQRVKRLQRCVYDSASGGCQDVAFGRWVATGSDVNGDGVPDVFVASQFEIGPGITQASQGRGSVSLVSGKTGQTLWVELGGNDGSGQEGAVGRPYSIGILDDLDRDGFPEFGIAYPIPDYDEFGDGGRVRIYKGGPGDATVACAGAVNSTGLSARLDVPWAISTSSNVFRLQAVGVPAGETGIFIYGPPRAPVPFGDGQLCVGVPMVRMGPPLAATADLAAWLHVDLAAGPFTRGPAPLLTGSSWRFQFAYQDPMGPGGSGLNLSEAKDILFAP